MVRADHSSGFEESLSSAQDNIQITIQYNPGIRMKKKSPKFSIKSSGKISHLKSQISPNYSLSLIIYIDWQLPPPPDRLAHIYSTATHHLHPTRGKSEHFPLIPTCTTAPSLDLRCLGVSEGRQCCLGLDRGKEMLWEKVETRNTCL